MNAAKIARAIYRERRTITNALQRGGLEASLCEDAMQEVVIVVLRAVLEGRCSLEYRPAFKAYLWRVANRLGRSMAAAQRRRLRLDRVTEAEPLAPSYEDLKVIRETVRMLRDGTKPERWRAVRGYVNGVSIAEIARREGVPLATVYNWMRLARRDFAAVIRRERARDDGPPTPRQPPPAQLLALLGVVVQDANDPPPSSKK